MNHSQIAFVGGGHMASALIGGLLRAGRSPQSIQVVEPFEAQRARLAQEFGVTPQAAADERLAAADECDLRMVHATQCSQRQLSGPGL